MCFVDCKRKSIDFILFLFAVVQIVKQYVSPGMMQNISINVIDYKGIQYVLAVLNDVHLLGFM